MSVEGLSVEVGIVTSIDKNDRSYTVDVLEGTVISSNIRNAKIMLNKIAIKGDDIADKKNHIHEGMFVLVVPNKLYKELTSDYIYI